MEFKDKIRKCLRGALKKFDFLFFRKDSGFRFLDGQSFDFYVVPSERLMKGHQIKVVFDNEEEIYKKFQNLYWELANKVWEKGGRFRFLDVGSRGDSVFKHWEDLKEFSEFHCFDIDQNKEVGDVDKSDYVFHYNYLISGKNGHEEFYLRKNPYGSSIAHPEEEFYGRLKHVQKNKTALEGMEVLETLEVPSITLDRWFSEYQLDGVDFFKVDVEGSELTVLRGASKILENAVGGLVEVDLRDRMKINNDFGETQSLLRKHGYFLADFEDILRSGRSASGQDFFQLKNGKKSSYGSISGLNALYLRDPIHHSQDFREFSDLKVLKLAVIQGKNHLFEDSFELLKKLEVDTQDRELKAWLEGLRSRFEY